MRTGGVQLPVLVLALSLLGLSFGLYDFFRRWRQQRMLQDTPAARIRSAPQGYVKLTGRAKPLSGKTLRAPLTGRSCVWWKYTVHTRANGPGTLWRVEDRGASDQPFLLTEQADQCLVDPAGADIEPSERRIWCGESPLMPTFSVLGFSPFASAQTNRYMEAIIIEDAQLSVLGELRSDSGSVANSLEDEAAVRLSQWKADQKTLLARFDSNHDGRIDTVEWERARTAARDEVEQERLQRVPQQRLRLILKPTEGRPYLIAALPCEQLVTREARRAIGGLTLTLLCLCAACYALLHLHLSG
jgi:hypothetical protein